MLTLHGRIHLKNYSTAGCLLLILLYLLATGLGISSTAQRSTQERRSSDQYIIGELLDKPGAVKGSRSWNDPWELKSANFHVKSNISPEATREIARVMEALLHNFNKLFDASIPSRIEVLVPKVRSTFLQIRRVPKGVRGWFQPKRGGGRIVTYYQPGKASKTTDVLLHEGTHLVVMLALTNLNTPDIWVNEGLAVYFEASQFDKTNLVIGKKPRRRLKIAKKLIKTEKFIPIKELIQKPRETFNARDYAQAWSLVYYLLHAHDHKRADRFNKYLLSFKKAPSMNAKKRFLLAFRTPFEKIETDWIRFVKSLDANKDDTVTITGER